MNVFPEMWRVAYFLFTHNIHSRQRQGERPASFPTPPVHARNNNGGKSQGGEIENAKFVKRCRLTTVKD
jgi:hypothetical protein